MGNKIQNYFDTLEGKIYAKSKGKIVKGPNDFDKFKLIR